MNHEEKVCVRLERAPFPAAEEAEQILLSDKTMAQRRERVLARMREAGLDVLIVYGDVEHGGNFEYLTGFIPRFEEGLLVLRSDGACGLILGNENQKLAAHSRIPCRTWLYPPFSLPNQPQNGTRPLSQLLAEAGVESGSRAGLAGWKLFIGSQAEEQFDVPAFVYQAVCQSAATVVSANGLFIGAQGVRRINSANEVAHYAYGAELSWNCLLRTMNRARPGIAECDLADTLNGKGQRPNVVTICAGGSRYHKANLYPSQRRLQLGDPLALTCGYKGGLSSRAAWLAGGPEDLPEEQQRFVEDLAVPYFAALAIWLEEIRVGCTGKEIYELMERMLPRKRYHWHLCPGHLTADEEWLASPIYEGSEERLESGMLFQLDLIPSRPPLGRVGCEDGLCLADEALRRAIEWEYPALYQRMQARRAYMLRALGIRLSPDVLPLSGGLAYYRPYLLSPELVLRKQ